MLVRDGRFDAAAACGATGVGVSEPEELHLLQ